jgi:hypothetical protein
LKGTFRSSAVRFVGGLRLKDARTYELTGFEIRVDPRGIAKVVRLPHFDINSAAGHLLQDRGSAVAQHLGA